MLTVYVPTSFHALLITYESLCNVILPQLLVIGLLYLTEMFYRFSLILSSNDCSYPQLVVVLLSHIHD
ncbi:hypothetical protein CsSME_00017243 [Camellia sinensis var. sinensis]